MIAGLIGFAIGAVVALAVAYVLFCIAFMKAWG